MYIVLCLGSATPEIEIYVARKYLFFSIKIFKNETFLRNKIKVFWS